ncbi:YeiH family protein [Ferrimonas senticii]|uniref:YeiH family protein n=1 Tax=Ferrimonas senticii TaxID=394566 RepID=UPI0006890A9A|nr:putative sulfate exporter family transporter [Ferrimonas senticii]
MSRWIQRPTDWGFWLVAGLCLLPSVNSPMALMFGLVLATIGWIPQGISVSALAKTLLGWAIIGLGFGIHLEQAIAVTIDSIGIVVTTIFGTLLVGTLLARWLKVERVTGHLIASGTAICGGSAIAAVAPAINANDDQTSVALATVFVLNSIALFIFPVIGHWFELSQQQFGVWAAIAIHDTSSVVGAAGAYGDQALATATTVKLARALWIIPVALLSALLFRSQGKGLAIPQFIVLYVAAMVVAWLFPAGEAIYQGIFQISKQVMVLCLFLIGAGITLPKLRQAGSQPLLLGVLLWLVISSSSLAYLLL